MPAKSSGEDQPIVVHSVLHGYDGGHRRLAGSVSLPRTAEALLLVISDMSGSQLVAGYESYLTGYPLPECDYFALGRTWYAPEMPRPGSVWTHTLLVNFADLARVRNVGRLVDAFRRPQGLGDFSEYDQSILVQPRVSFRGSSPSLLGMITRILKALYETPDEPVFVVSSRADLYENLILEIWAQQWPLLRSNFRFCTGSIEDRAEQGSEFDLQIVPPAAVSRVRSRPRAAQIVDGDTDSEISVLDSDWLHAAARDLVQDGENSFRGFLLQFAEKVPAPRQLFRPLADIYSQVYDSQVHDAKRHNTVAAVRDLIRLVTSYFPRRLDAVSLKKALLGEPRDRHTGPGVVNAEETVLLEALIGTASVQGLDEEVLAIRMRARSLWRLAREDARRIVRFRSPNAIAAAFAAGIAEEVSPSELMTLVRRDFTLALWFISRRPEFAAVPELWSAFPDHISELLAVLEVEGNDWDRKAISGLTRAALDTGANGRLASRILQLFGRPGVFACLDWVEEATDNGAAIGSGWRAALAMRPADLLEWVRARGSTSGTWVVASLVEPDLALSVVGVEPWLALVLRGPKGGDPVANLNALAFLFVVGMQAQSGGGPLIAFSLELLHQALATDSLPERAWRLLSGALPRTEQHLEWDRCARLRQGVVRYFWQGPEDLRYFFMAFKEPSTFRYSLQDLKNVPGGEQVRGRLIEFARSHNDVLTREQTALLQKKRRSGFSFLWQDED